MNSQKMIVLIYMIIYIYICLPTRKTRDTEILKFTCINRMIYNYNNVLVRVLSSNKCVMEILLKQCTCKLVFSKELKLCLYIDLCSNTTSMHGHSFNYCI